MKKGEFIRKYGENMYNKHLIRNTEWKRANPERKKEHKRAQTRKGGKYYESYLRYKETGIPGQKNKIRSNHSRQWQSYKKRIAPDSQIHHQWIPDTAEYTGVALVERKQHSHGIIKVIQILEGNITLLTEEEIRFGG